MPRFGRAHKLLSGHHPDTSPPADGADPDDGQLVEWSDALEAWVAADPPDVDGAIEDHEGAANPHTVYVLKSLLTTRGDMIRRGASAPERFAKGTAGKLLEMGANDPAWKWQPAAIEYVIDGGGEAIATGSAGGLIVPFDCFVTGWTVHATGGQTGAIVVDVNYHATTVPATTSIAGSEKPGIASGSEGEDLTLTTWTQALAKGGSLVFDVDSNAGAHERVVVCLYVDKGRAS